MRIKASLLKKKQASQFKFKCPVYLCKGGYQTESDMLAHYNSSHKDLVDLGLTMVKSKETRSIEKKQRTNKIVLNTEEDTQTKPDDEDSFSEESHEDVEDIYKDTEGISSELEDLLELEKIELNRKRQRRDQRQLRRGQRHLD